MSSTPICDAWRCAPGQDGLVAAKFNAFLDEVIAPIERRLNAPVPEVEGQIATTLCAGAEYVPADLARDLGRRLAVRKNWVRYCPECGTIGESPEGKHCCPEGKQCCPDFTHAALVPLAVAWQARKGFYCD